jgi:hypothetical protein
MTRFNYRVRKSSTFAVCSGIEAAVILDPKRSAAEWGAGIHASESTRSKPIQKLAVDAECVHDVSIDLTGIPGNRRLPANSRGPT